MAEPGPEIAKMEEADACVGRVGGEPSSKGSHTPAATGLSGYESGLSSDARSTATTAFSSQAVHPPHFVAPSHYLRPPPRQSSRPTAVHAQPANSQREKQPMSVLDKEQIEGLRAIRAFLKVRTGYDVLPLSYRLIVFDTSLLVKKSLNVMSTTGVVSAPLWDSKRSAFAGMLTVSDYLNMVQYYVQNPDALQQIDQFRLDSLRDIERAIGVSPIETVSTSPSVHLYDACRRMLDSRARRIPLVDRDDETKRQMVVSVITQYRILKFISVNVTQTQLLRKPLRDLKLGTYTNLCTCRMDTPVMWVIQELVKRTISCIPVLAEDGTVLNVFEAVDIIALLKGGDYTASLSISVGKAIDKRPEDFPGIYTCTPNDRLETLFDVIKKSRVHRLVIIDDEKKLQGVLSLSDILNYALNSPLGDDGE